MIKKRPNRELPEFDANVKIGHIPLYVCVIFSAELNDSMIKGVANAVGASIWLDMLAKKYNDFDPLFNIGWHSDFWGFDYGNRTVRAVHCCGGEIIK